MKISIILAHPKEGSFNHAIAKTCKKMLEKRAHQVMMHDLYREKFDPLLLPDEFDKDFNPKGHLKKYCDEIAKADGILMVHPNWWGQPPAILKGWVDRVMRQGVAYKFGVNDKGEGVPIGLLKAKTALVFTTSNTPEEREQAIFGDPLENLWKNCVFDFCGVKNFYRKNFGVVIISSPDERKRWLEEVVCAIEKHF